MSLGFILPGRPHPLLAPEKNPGWMRLRKAYEKVAKKIQQEKPDVILIYSTQWLSVIGHQMQAFPKPKFCHVDYDWHELGQIDYEFRMDSYFSKSYVECARARGLHAREVAYNGFPIDTGTVTALKLINPGNEFMASVVSCNMYSDRAETLVLGKAAQDAAQKSGKSIVAVAITALSNRLFSKPFSDSEDRIYSQKDDEWNLKLLELLGEGRLEDVSQLAREFSAQAHGDQKMKALWWLTAVLGQNNNYKGIVHAYEPICGSGAAVVELQTSPEKSFEREFDEENVEFFGVNSRSKLKIETVDDGKKSGPVGKSSVTISSPLAPKPVGNYPHARRVGDFVFLSGIGPRNPITNEIPGGPVRNEQGPLAYDIEKQTRACVENVRVILESADLSLKDIVDVQVFLIDMEMDFKTFNKVYGEFFQSDGPTRTTVSVSALPTPIAVELKVIAKTPTQKELLSRQS